MKDNSLQTNNTEKIRKEYSEKIVTGGNSIHTVLDAAGPVTNYLYDYYSKYYIEKYANFNKEDVVLDFGCGLGRLSEKYAPFVKRIVAVDLSSELIDLAKSNSVNKSNVSYRLINSLSDLDNNLPLFDKIYVFGVFLYINDSDLGSVINEFKRLSKEGVRLVFIEPTLVASQIKDDSLYYRTVNDYISLFKEGGFKLLHSKEIIRTPSYSFNLLKKIGLHHALLLPFYRVFEMLTIKRKKEYVEGYWHLFVFQS